VSELVIESIIIERRTIPLRDTYKLSFAQLSSFDACLAHIFWSDGRFTCGEVVPLPGYHQEDSCEVCETAEKLTMELNGVGPEDARQRQKN
jgi:hypothetical protein